MKTNAKPLATVLIPVYNAQSHLDQALESIKNQSFANFECFVIDDGSIDESRKIVEKYVKNDNRFRLIKHKSNQGLIFSLNEGLSKAKGKYIVRMDADDISTIDRLKTQVGYMEKNTDIGICGSWIKVFGFHNYIWKTSVNHDEIVCKMIFECPIAHPSIIMRKSSLDKNNLRYPNRYKHAEDYAFWMLASRKIKFANIPKVLLKYRTHKKQIGQTQRNHQESASQKIRIYQASRLEIPSNEEKLIHAKLGSWVQLYSYREISAMVGWLNKLHKGNKGKKMYSKAIFDAILAKRLFVELVISKKLPALKWVYAIKYPYMYKTFIQIILAKILPNKFSINL